MRYTLIELTQRILEALDGDEVNSFADTAESLAVANIIKECYYEIITELEPKESEGLFHLDASTDNTKPCVMYLPATVSNIKHLKYNVGDTVTDTNFRDLDYMPVTQFFDYMNGLDSYGENWVDTQVVTMAGGDFNIKYRNDNHPSYWTSPDDHTIIFDSYDSSVETTLTSARTYGIGALVPTFVMSDTYVPQIDARQFQLLLNAAKAQAFVEIKQTANEKAERKERKHRILGYKTQDNTDNRTPLEKRRNSRKGYGR